MTEIFIRIFFTSDVQKWELITEFPFNSYEINFTKIEGEENSLWEDGGGGDERSVAIWGSDFGRLSLLRTQLKYI